MGKMTILYRLHRHLFLVLSCRWTNVNAFAVVRHNHPSSSSISGDYPRMVEQSRREAFADILASLPAATLVALVIRPVASVNAYNPDPDPLRESLYLISRVQEATCLQERYIQKASPPIDKMKLTLRLMDKSYRLLDQINLVSKFIPPEDVVMATQVGDEAADSLQDAIDFVYGFQKDGNAMTTDQKQFLLAALTEVREKLFDFVDYLPEPKKLDLSKARARVEEENKLNMEEFDPDLVNDAGVYNPVVMPWKNRDSQLNKSAGY